jgi:hypothetical protein
MSSTPKPVRYERPTLERFGTFRELTQSGSGTPTCDAVFQIGASTSLPNDTLGRCYD